MKAWGRFTVVSGLEPEEEAPGGELRVVARAEEALLKAVAIPAHTVSLCQSLRLGVETPCVRVSSVGWAAC